ncbi:N-6 DNA methylase [Helicobacter sp. 23-1045]
MNNELINKAIQKGIITFSDDKKLITYTYQNKERKYHNPEEKVQALTFCKLVLEYGYPQEQIKLFASIQMGSSTKEADIVVYSDKDCKIPHIIVECKKQEISDLEFQNAINQAFSYAVAEGARFVWVSSGLKDEYYQVLDKKPKDRSAIPDIPAFGSNKILNFKYVRGGKIGAQKYFDLQKISESDLTQAFKQAHNALWGGGELNPSTAFDELDKLIFCKIWDEKNTPREKPYQFQFIAREENGKLVSNKILNEELAQRIHSLYEQGRKKDSEVFKDNIRLSPEKIRSVVGYLEKINLSQTDLDSKGRAFETFMGSFFRGDFGQYFTPRQIVDFIVQVLPIDNNSIVLDTSCGSGGFLLHALDKVRKLADENFGERDENGNLKRYENGEVIINKQDISDHYKFWHDFAQNNLFGIEINEQIARVAKMNMIIHDDGHTNIIVCDGLSPITQNNCEYSSKDKEKLEQQNANTIANKTNNANFKENYFDFIITNPPFGSIIKQTERAYLHQYNFSNKEVNWLDIKDKVEREKRENQNTEVLFIEQAYRFLKEKGFLAIVIPDGILTNSSLQYVRDAIEEMYKIVAVVSMPQTAFSHTGAGVKSSVLFLQKHKSETTKKIKETKFLLQTHIKTKFQYIDKITALEYTKKQALKKLNKDYPSKETKQREPYISKKSDIVQKYKEQVENLQSPLIKSYELEKAQIFQKEGLDYDIFMAIAENIGYDATGKATGINELDSIAQHLRDFLAQIAE